MDGLRTWFGCTVCCAALGGCVKDNPAWEGAETGVGGTTGSGGGSGESGVGDASSSGSGVVPTTTGGGLETGGTTDSQGDSTTGAVDPTTGGSDTGAASSTGGESSTGEPALHCSASEFMLVDIDNNNLVDAGVVPDSMGQPCPWNDMEQDCGPLNFGKTGFFRLVNDAELGKSAGLLRFDADAVTGFIEDAGLEMKDLLGLRVQLVVWEPLGVPTQDSELEIGMLVGEETMWAEGSRDAEKATDNESSALCRTIEKGACTPWPQDDAPMSSESIGLLLVTPEAVMEADQDDKDDEYHAYLRSEPLKGLLAAYMAGKQPSLLVSLISTRGLDEGQIGIKLKEAEEWLHPVLYLEVCTEWSP